MRSYNIIVSPYQKNTVDTKFYFKQNDYGIPVSITVEDYDTSGTTAKIVFRRADEVTREYNIVKSSDGTYKYNLSADEIYYPGKVFVDLKFYKDGVRESTASFIYHVIADKVGETFASGDYSDSIARAIESCNQAIANIQEQANQAIEDVENALLAELNVYDGYDKTTIGFAADARQLNENVANSYAAKVKEKIDTNTNLINALNNNLTPQLIDISNGDYGTVEYNGSYKSANIVCIQVDISNITVSTLGWRNIGKISLGNRPSNGVSCSCFEIVTTEPYTVNIDFVGNINMYFNTPVSGKRVRIAGAYIVL